MAATAADAAPPVPAAPTGVPPSPPPSPALPWPHSQLPPPHHAPLTLPARLTPATAGARAHPAPKSGSDLGLPVGVLHAADAAVGAPELGQLPLRGTEPLLEGVHSLLEVLCRWQDPLQAAIPAPGRLGEPGRATASSLASARQRSWLEKPPLPLPPGLGAQCPHPGCPCPVLPTPNIPTLNARDEARPASPTQPRRHHEHPEDRLQVSWAEGPAPSQQGLGTRGHRMRQPLPGCASPSLVP